MTRRVSVVVLLLALVVGAFVIDHNVAADDEVLGTAAPEQGLRPGAFPVAADTTDRSSTWFCAGGTADEEAFADHVITMLNPTDAPMTVQLTAFGGVVAPAPERDEVDDALDDEAEDDTDAAESTDATTTDDTASDDTGSASTASSPVEPVERTIELPALTRRRLALTELLTAPIASALVEAPVGGLIVEHEVRSIHGIDAKPCATAASDTWHLAWGTTERDARELLVLFNPFPDDAIVEGRFATEDGVREPVRFAGGIVVPARSTVAVDLGDDVTRRAEVAATLTARTGRVVVDRILRINDADGARGLTVQLGVPEPQEAWVFADGFSSEAVRETYVVYNPGQATAEVSIELTLDRPEENGIPEPVELSLAPGTQATVDLTADGRIPEGVAHAAVVRSANGIPVVAERVLFADGDDRQGIAVTTGSPVEAEEWFFAAGATNSVTDEWIVVVNLDPQVLSEIDVVAVVNGQAVPVSELQGLVVEAGERIAIRLGERIQRDDLSIVVQASEPVVVERGLYRVGEDQRGTSNAVGIPGPVGLRMPGDPLEVELDVDLGDDGVDPGADDPDDGAPSAPDDVDLPDPDETIVFDDPDAEADVPADGSTTTTSGSGPGDDGSDGADGGADADPTTSTTAGGVPDTTP